MTETRIPASLVAVTNNVTSVMLVKKIDWPIRKVATFLYLMAAWYVWTLSRRGETPTRVLTTDLT